MADEMKIAVRKLKEDARLPVFGSDAAAGADLFANTEWPVRILPGTSAMISTGIAMAIPAGYAGFIYARSGLSTKQGLAPANKVGVIDADYRGEIRVCLHNHSGQVREIKDGDRIAQIVISKVERPTYFYADELPETDRGEGGFGSTGV